MKIVILERGSVGSEIDMSQFEKLGEIISYDSTEPDQIAERVQDADVVVINKSAMNEKTIGNATHLKLITLLATGYDAVDLAYCRKKGIKVANVKNYSTDSVAQHTFALLFYLLEHLPKYDTYVKDGSYQNQKVFSYYGLSYRELQGKTWGIIGMGNIGKKVASIATAFGCHVQYCSISGKTHIPEYEEVSFDELCESADVLSIHCPLTDMTRGLMNQQVFAKMKKSAILINVARGAVVCEQDLYNALITGEIAAAGLDVVSKEPILETNPLLQLCDSDKLVITPHMAWASVEARERLVQEVYQNIWSFQQGIDRNLV